MSDLRRPILVAPVGIPGCGKSTFAAHCIKAGLFRPSQVVSTDAIRHALCGNISDQSRNAEVFNFAYHAMKTSLELGRTTFADATNVTPSALEQMKNLSTDTGHGMLGSQIVWIDFDVDYEVACERNLSRPQPVPPDVMGRMRDLKAAVDWSDLAQWGLVTNPTSALEILESSLA